MAAGTLLTEFFARHGALTKDEFLAAFSGFLLLRHRKEPPQIIPLSSQPDARMVFGSDEDCDVEVDDPTLDPEHLVVVYNPGFKGWTAEDQGTNFGTHLQGDRLSKGRPVLLADKSSLKLGGGMTELQFYMAETLFARMSQAGITRSMRQRSERLAQQSGAAEPAAGGEEP